MFAFSISKLEITVNTGQKLMEAVLIGPIGDMMHTQEGTLLFLQNGDSFIF